MDTSEGAKNNGNGKHVPDSGSLPSTVPAGGNGHPPEPLVVVDRDAKGRILPGRSLNPRGKPKGIPNRNAELVKLINTRELSWCWRTAKAQAKKGDDALLRFLLDKALLDQSPASAGIVINNNPTASAGASANNESYDDARKLFADAAGRGLVAGLAERLAACEALTGEPRHVRQ